MAWVLVEAEQLDFGAAVRWEDGMGRRGYIARVPPPGPGPLEAGRPIADVARDLRVSEQTISTWRHQDRIDRPGASDNAELVAARPRADPDIADDRGVTPADIADDSVTDLLD